jgi:two-component system, OmpR family, response regulator
VNIHEGNLVRVLVVDDYIDSADSLAYLGGLWGYETRACYDGASALKTAARFSPHVVFIDLGLPDMDGFEVASRLRMQPGSIPAVLVAVSGWQGDRLENRVQKAGFTHYFLKPANLDGLQDLLHRVAHSLSSVFAPVVLFEAGLESCLQGVVR